MNRTILALGFASLIGASLLRAEEDNAGVAPNRISFFAVPLQCPAAPQIGCGLVSKPILVELEHQPTIKEAWLNESGTLIAVVWRNSADPEAGTNAAQRVLQNHGLTATEPAAAERAVDLKSFTSGQAWYHSTEVEILSKEEAKIIAARLVRRVQAKAGLSDDKAKALETRFYEFMASPVMLAMSSRHTWIETAAPALLKVARELLSQNEVEAVREAIGKGFLPVAGDKEEAKGKFPDCCSR
jgi:hypothetical protein